MNFELNDAHQDTPMYVLMCHGREMGTTARKESNREVRKKEKTNSANGGTDAFRGLNGFGNSGSALAHPLDRWTSQAQLQQTLSLRCWTDWRLHPGIQMTLLRGNEKEARSASGPATSFLPVVPVPSHHACHARTGHDDLTRLTRAVHCLPAGPAQSSRSHSLL